jgi:hypothetical protein
VLVGRHSSPCSTMRAGSSSRSACPSCLTNGPSNLQATRAHTPPRSCFRSASVTAFTQVKMRQLKLEASGLGATRTVRTVRVDRPPVCVLACGGRAEMSVLPIAIRLVVHPTIVDPAELGEGARSCRTFEVDGRRRRGVDPDPGTKAVLLVFEVLDEADGPSRRRAGVQNGITGCKRERPGQSRFLQSCGIAHVDRRTQPRDDVTRGGVERPPPSCTGRSARCPNTLAPGRRVGPPRPWRLARRLGLL